MNTSIILENVIPRVPESPYNMPINWEVKSDEIWGVVGANGSGKSLLAEMIEGSRAIKSGKIRYPLLHTSQYIKKIDFNLAYSLLDYRKLFYQQRFNNSENEGLPLVREVLNVGSLPKESLKIFNELHLFDLMDRKLIHLSSGELRKLLITKVLIDKPRIIIFDNPFIGLDEESRNLLEELFNFLISESGIQLLFLAPSKKDLPICVNRILELKGRKLTDVEGEKHINWNFFSTEDLSFNGNEMVSMRNIDITYGERTIQSGLNWKINRNERWALLGPNGSGKSTLLSYIFADNPMAYTKEISLFGRKRGSGEDIWGIKRRIGFTSSEMHLYYRKNVDSFTVVASGFFDSIGLYRKCNEQQISMAAKLMEIMGIAHLKNRPFLHISSGEQRLILFARAIIKNPELLILDEPFHGLDESNKKLCTSIVESFVEQWGKSLIYVTHRRDEIPDCIDRFMILKPRHDMVQ